MGSNFSVSCDGTNVFSADPTVSIEYKDDSADIWTQMDSTKLVPFELYSHGDSITAANRWQAYLDQNMLSNLSAVNSLNSSQKIYNHARAGWTCKMVYEGLEGKGAFSQTIPNNTKTIILCGINGYINMNSNKHHMELIQKDATSRNISLVWVSVLTATKATLNSNSQLPEIIYTLNEWLRTNLTKRYNSSFIDVHRTIWNGTYGFCNPDFCSSDGLHPSSKGYEKIAEKIWASEFNNKKFNTHWGTSKVADEFSGKYINIRCNVTDEFGISDYFYLNDSLYVNQSILNLTETNEVSPPSSSSGGGSSKSSSKNNKIPPSSGGGSKPSSKNNTLSSYSSGGESRVPSPLKTETLFEKIEDIIQGDGFVYKILKIIFVVVLVTFIILMLKRKKKVELI